MDRARRIGRRALVVLGLALLAAGCGDDDRVIPRPTASDLPSEEVRDFTLDESDQGQLEWTMHADYAASYQQRGVVEARNVAVEFFDEHGQKYSHLVAQQGVVHQPSNDMEAKGQVVVTTTDGVRVETDHLRFLNRERRIDSDAFVRLTRHGDVVTGVGFTSDPSLEHFTLKHEVRAQVRSDSPNGGLRFQERGKS
jgi:LPS export ABC transporter protein LptC